MFLFDLTLALLWRELVITPWFSLAHLLRPPLRLLLFVRHARERAQALTV